MVTKDPHFSGCDVLHFAEGRERLLPADRQRILSLLVCCPPRRTGNIDIARTVFVFVMASLISWGTGNDVSLEIDVKQTVHRPIPISENQRFSGPKAS